MICSACDGTGEIIADKVSIHGMFDMHLFHPVTGNTVDEVIANWLEYISKPIPAMVGDRKVEDMGPSSLCPAIVSVKGKELRRVGEMVYADYMQNKPNPSDINRYCEALKADPDIPRLLAEAYGEIKQ